MTDLAAAFSSNYASARTRFQAAAQARGFRLESFPIGRTGPDGEALSIDAAVLGSTTPERVMIVSSGLHGIEGFFGSAVQVAYLESLQHTWIPGANDALVFLHALNPFGFAWRRRFDEENVDLNRNFLVEGPSEPEGLVQYAALNRLLNPDRPPSRLDLFRVQAVLAILRYGMGNLKAAIAGGQYEYPRGIFYGGKGPSQGHQILAQNLPRWVGNARSVLHLDFHTGLGPWASYRLLLEPGVKSARIDWLNKVFGSERVESQDVNGISYPTRGDLGSWCRTTFPECRYDYLCAEFGTYSGLRVLAAIRAENQAHHWLMPTDPAYERTKRGLQEAFAPEDRFWRESTVAQAIDLIERGRSAVFEPRSLATPALSD